MSEKQNELLNTALDLARLCLKFGRVERITKHEDGIRPETDTDHTVMLGIMACAFAAEFGGRLNLGLIAQFALVHDLVEAYAGDTVTSSVLSAEEKQAKADREHQAFLRIEDEFKDRLDWIHWRISDYERQLLPEARFVKAFDKVLPKLTHILNNCAVVKKTSYDFYHNEQRTLMRELVAGEPWLLQLWEESVAEVMRIDGNNE